MIKIRVVLVLVGTCNAWTINDEDQFMELPSVPRTGELVRMSQSTQIKWGEGLQHDIDNNIVDEEDVPYYNKALKEGLDDYIEVTAVRYDEGYDFPTIFIGNYRYEH